MNSQLKIAARRWKNFTPVAAAWLLAAAVLPVFVIARAGDDTAAEAGAPADRQTVPAEPVGTGTPIDFSRDIRPLLSDACFACHGPDEQHRQADLRLDQGDNHAVIPGDSQASDLMVRILSQDPSEQMPPPESGKTLSPEAIELLRRWIDQGAVYSEHWAFTPPQKPAIPAVGNLAWPRSPIDNFVLARLEQEQLAPAEPAERATLLRRVYLDLIGLPPSPAEVAAFVADRSPLALEQVVDRLLQSAHYGERWGRVWLDAARYADSDGFEKDKPRFVWFYRDWVVRALNADMPYNDFIIKQLAGDLLPEPTQDDRVATGFLRNSMINEEGGVDPEQFRMEAMFDRIDAIGKSVLGLTIQCAQCHTHKYDPISHADYYGLFAFINNCHEACITVYTPEEQAERAAVLAEVDAILDQFWNEVPNAQDRLRRWETDAKGSPQSPWQPVAIDFDAESIGGQKFLRQDDGSYLAAGYAPTKFHPIGDVTVHSHAKITAVRVEMLGDPNLPHGGPGRSVDGTWALSDLELQVAKLDASGKERWEKLPWASAAATIDLPQTPLGARYDDKSNTQRLLGPVAMAIDGNHATAWHGDLGPGRRNDPQTAMFVLAEPITATAAAETATDQQAAQPLRFRIKLSQMHGGWNSDDNQTHNLGRFRVSVTASDQPAIEPLPPQVMQTLEIPWEQRTAEQWRRLLGQFIEGQQDLQELAQRLDAAWQRHPVGSSQLVLAERADRRPTRRLERGDFLCPREPIQAAIPALFRQSAAVEHQANPAAEQPLNRLDLAQWLTAADHPTTARSIVNRVWQEYFGTGITATSDDLGMQGEPPSHPELLDYLAVDFVENGWSLKHLHRQIVLSATYGQASSVSQQHREADPQNRLLARGPRLRVPAETVRDISLAASGLLNASVGGEPVYPPAPEFLFKPPASYGPKTWQPSTGGDAFRRALYTFRFRSVPYPVLQTFDAPNGDVSCVRRTSSNTPLQALATLNEPMFLDCARQLAQRAIKFQDDAAAIEFIFASCTSRMPEAQERSVLRDLLKEQRTRYAAEPELAEQLAGAAAQTIGSGGSSPQGASELAAWTVVCRVVLNLDETITKP